MNRRSDPPRQGRPPAGLPLPAQTAGDRTGPAGTPVRDAPASPPRAATGRAAGRPRSRTTRLQADLAERTADLQRLKAEYDNYRKRAQRDRSAMYDMGVAHALRSLLPVLDAITRARELGDVYGGFQLVAETLEAELAELGLEAFGMPGDAFDPTRHEAVGYVPSARTGRATCSEVLLRGYRVGDRLLRPARVTVTGPPPQRRGLQPAHGERSPVPPGPSGEVGRGHPGRMAGRPLHEFDPVAVGVGQP
ncbi:molecular chaperone GrpE [Thermocatellispora tengchongensis]|uniref:Protein GrpE n=1 Tax=Thermocatellispora tengchongensis TaxID=1073253 RepID=A0A840PIZ2_9ACTN|nr:nucleotide exchange factor GrpE [Thermocatellispora tengchongensis]MBB5137781.1 molecular chaperone GrpE [Thermocatellispora tengchongensis]